MSPGHTVKKKPRKKATLVRYPKRILSAHEHSYYKTAFSQSRVTILNLKKKNEQLLENNRSLAMALEAAEINRQQQEQIMLQLKRQLTLTNPSTVKENVRKIGMLLQQVVSLTADTLELTGGIYDDETTVMLPLQLQTQSTSAVTDDCFVHEQLSTTPVRNSDSLPRRRSLQNDLREKFGMTDLTVINEDTVRLQEINLPAMLFTDGKENNSARNSRRNSSHHKSSRKGRSTTISGPQSPVNGEANDLSCGDHVKFGELSCRNSQAGMICDPATSIAIQDNTSDNSSVKSYGRRASTERPKLSLFQFHGPQSAETPCAPKTPVLSLTVSAKIGPQSEKTPCTPKMQVLPSAVRAKTNSIVKSNIPRLIKDKPKTNTEANVLCDDLSADVMLRRGTFVVLNPVSQSNVEKTPQELPSCFTGITEGASPPSSYTRNNCMMQDLKVTGNNKVTHCAEQTIFPSATQERNPILDTYNYWNMKCNFQNADDVTVNLNEDMEFTCPVGGIISCVPSLPEMNTEKTEMSTNPPLQSHISFSGDADSDATEIYCVQAYSNLPAENLEKEIPSQSNTTESAVNSEGSDSVPVAAQSAEIIDSQKVVSKNSSKKQHVQQIAPTTSVSNSTRSRSKSIKHDTCPPAAERNKTGKMQALKIPADIHTNQSLDSEQLTSDRSAKVHIQDAETGIPSAELGSLPSTVCLESDRRGTFVISQSLEKQLLEGQPGPPSYKSSQSKKATKTNLIGLIDDSSDFVSEPELTGGPSEHSPRGLRKSQSEIKSSGNGSRLSQPDKQRSDHRKSKSSMLLMAISRNKKKSAREEPYFKFFSKKTAIVSKTVDRECVKTDKSHEVNKKERDVYDVNISSCLDSDTDCPAGKSSRKGVSESTHQTKLKHKSVSSQKRKMNQEVSDKSSQNRLTDKSHQTKDTSPASKSWKRKSTARGDEKSKKAKLSKEIDPVKVLHSSNEKSDSSNAPPNEKEHLPHRLDLRCKDKRKSVSFRMPSATDICEFKKLESVCKLINDENIINDKNSKESDASKEKSNEPLKFTSDVHAVTSPNRTELKDSLVILEDIFSPANLNGSSKKSNAEGRTSVGIAQHSDSTKTADESNPSTSEVSKNEFVVNSLDQGTMINAKSVSKDEITADSPEHSTDKENVESSEVINFTSNGTVTTNTSNKAAGKVKRSRQSRKSKGFSRQSRKSKARSSDTRVKLMRASTTRLISDESMRDKLPDLFSAVPIIPSEIEASSQRPSKTKISKHARKSSSKGVIDADAVVILTVLQNGDMNAAPTETDIKGVSEVSHSKTDSGVLDAVVSTAGNPNIGSTAQNAELESGEYVAPKPQKLSTGVASSRPSRSKASSQNGSKSRASKRVSKSHASDVANESKKENDSSSSRFSSVGVICRETVQETDCDKTPVRLRRKSSVVSYKMMPLNRKLRRGDPTF